jgi:hypothetical protein
MRNFDKQKDYWKPCRPGTILKAVDSKLQRDRRRFLIRAAMGAVVGGVGVFSAFFISTNNSRRRLASRKNEESSGLAITDIRGQENTRLAQLNVPTQFTCNDIKSNLDEFLVAYRLPGDQRSEEQIGLLLDFDMHLKICDKCLPLVNDALSRDVTG